MTDIVEMIQMKKGLKKTDYSMVKEVMNTIPTRAGDLNEYIEVLDREGLTEIADMLRSAKEMIYSASEKFEEKYDESWDFTKSVKKKWPAPEIVREIRGKTEDYYDFLAGASSRIIDSGCEMQDDLVDVLEALKQLAVWADDWEDHFQDAYGE